MKTNENLGVLFYGLLHQLTSTENHISAAMTRSKSTLGCLGINYNILHDYLQPPLNNLNKHLNYQPLLKGWYHANCHRMTNPLLWDSGILPEMYNFCSGDLLKCLVKFFTHVWESRSIPQDWKDAVLNPVLPLALFPAMWHKIACTSSIVGTLAGPSQVS